MPTLANAAQTDPQAPSDPQAYCVNPSADFYPYMGEPCKSGYQLGSGNCRQTDGRIVAVPKEQCVFREARKLGCEGIVSKRLDSLHPSGRFAGWGKVNN
jgi:hypothetical protein